MKITFDVDNLITVYILQCSDGSYYTGISKDLDRRLKEHTAGKSKSTKKKLPFNLIFNKNYPSYKEARRKEVEIKNMGALKFLARQRLNYHMIH